MSQHSFILSAFNLNLRCSVLECRFRVDDLEALRTIVDPDIDEDPEFDGPYIIDADDLNAINMRFTAGFQPERLADSEIEILLGRDRSINLLRDVPYLVHTGFELPLMLDGRKKLARFIGILPETEEAFDRWVQRDVLHKE